MTFSSSVRLFGCMTLTGVVLLISSSSAQAANVTLNAGGDTLGTSSFDNDGANNWSNGADPNAANDYFVSVKWLRSPGSGDHVFAGNSLTLQSGGGLLSKNGGPQTLTTNLILDGGYVRSGSGAPDILTLAGTIDVTANNGALVPDQSPFVIDASVTGTGTLYLLNDDSQYGFGTGSGPGRGIDFTGTSTFTGNVVADALDMVWTSTSSWTFDINGSGVNNQIAGTGGALFAGTFDFDLSGASSTPGDSWALVNVTGGQTFDPNTFNITGFTKSGSVWVNGAYTFNPSTGILAVAPPPIEWEFDVDGNFSDPNKWTGGAAPGTNGDALFGTVITADRTVTIDSNIQLNSITFSNPVNTGDYFLVDDPNDGANFVTLTGASNIDTQDGRHWMRVEIAGTSGLFATGGGELVLDANNSFTGGLSVENTNLAVTKSGAIPAGNTITAQNGAQVRFWGANNGFFGGTHGTGLDPNTTVTVNGAVSIDASSTVDVNDGADVAFTGGINDNGSLVSRSGATVSVSSAISGTGTVGVQGGDLTLSVANSYSGVTNVGTTGTGGTLTITNGSALGAADGTPATQTVTGGNGSTATLVLSGGIAVSNELMTMGAREGAAANAVSLSSTNGNNSWAGNIKGGVGGSQYNIESADPSGTLTLSGTLSAPDSGVRNFVFSGAGDTVVSGKITDLETDPNGEPISPSTNAADVVSVYKRGGGTLFINTNSSQQDDYWQAATVVEEGTLKVGSDGAGNGELWSKTITVQANGTLDVTDWQDDLGAPDYNLQIGQSLGGAGTVNVGSGALGVFDDNSLTPGDSVGTLNVSGDMNITNVGGGGALNYELGNTTAIDGSENDLIAVSGSLVTSGAAAFTVNVTPVEHALATSTYRAISHGGGTTNFSASTVQFLNPNNPDPNNPLNTRQSASINGSTAGQVNIAVSGSAASQTWTGSTDGDWDVANKTNWTGTGSQFFQLDNVTFNQTGSNQNVNVAEDVVPNAMTVTGSGADYNFSGSSISAGSITVSNNAVASFDNTVGGNVSVQNTGTVAGNGTLQDNVSVASGGKLRIGGVGLTAVSSGTVSLLDNFQGYTTGSYNGGSTAFVPNGGPWESNVGATGLVSIEEEDPNSPINQYAAFGWNSGTRGINRTAPTIADGSTGTYYFQVRTEDATPDVSYGLSDMPTGLLNSFGDFEAQVALTYAAADGIRLGARNGGVFEQLVTGLSADTWYDIWLVVDNDTDTYDVFYGTSGNPNGIASAIKIADDFGFRNGSAANDLVTFMTLANNHEDNNANLDNIYSGNLSVTGGPETLAIEGDLALAAGSTISFDIGQSGLNDSLDIGGTFSVTDGVVLEVLLDGSVSAGSLLAGDSWDLFDFDPNSVVGSWDPNDFTLPSGLASGLEWDTSNLLTTGVLSVASSFLPGDFNMDGRVDALDFLLWQRNPAVGNLADWSANYGLPATSNTTTVPEPSTISLLLGAVCCLVRRRRSRVSSTC